VTEWVFGDKGPVLGAENEVDVAKRLLGKYAIGAPLTRMCEVAEYSLNQHHSLDDAIRASFQTEEVDSHLGGITFFCGND
jgi:hypothetical protein